MSGPAPLVLGLASGHSPGLSKGLGLGLFLWLVVQVAVLPLLGWGLFGTAVTPKIAVATLVLHLIHGGALGWGLSR